mgnify:CR=1 FL=1
MRAAAATGSAWWPAPAAPAETVPAPAFTSGQAIPAPVSPSQTAPAAGVVTPDSVPPAGPGTYESPVPEPVTEPVSEYAAEPAGGYAPEVAETAPAAFTICAADGLGGIGMDEHEGSAGPGLFPNPADGPVSFTWTGPAADVRIDVLDMTGRSTHSELRHMMSGQVAVMSLGGRLAAGTYTVRLTGAGSRSSQRLVVR